MMDAMVPFTALVTNVVNALIMISVENVRVKVSITTMICTLSTNHWVVDVLDAGAEDQEVFGVDMVNLDHLLLTCGHILEPLVGVVASGAVLHIVGTVVDPGDVMVDNHLVIVPGTQK